MNIKDKAYELHLAGLSYKQIAVELQVSKTAAYEYVKEQKLTRALVNNKGVPNRSERNLKVDKPASVTESVAKSIKEFTGDELLKRQFDSLAFTGRFLELIGKPSKVFYAVIWGLPKGGKSNFAIRLADYLQEYFGQVTYIAAEEGESVTLQEKIRDIGGSRVRFVELRDREQIRLYLVTKHSDFVFIDSINNANIDNEFLELLKNENPDKSFIAIVQATKSGNFKGDQALTHNCDFVVKVISGIAYHEGRFSQASEANIFDRPWYEKNLNAKGELTANVEQTMTGHPMAKRPAPQNEANKQPTQSPVPQFLPETSNDLSTNLSLSETDKYNTNNSISNTPLSEKQKGEVALGLLTVAVLQWVFSSNK